VPEIVYEEGWHDLEANPTPITSSGAGPAEACCLIDNPAATLLVIGASQQGPGPGPESHLRINDQVLDEFVPKEVNFERSYTIKDMLETRRVLSNDRHR
jgi:hypothetical protein